jgi:hypothetical protein
LRYGPNHAVVKSIEDQDIEHHAVGAPGDILVVVAGGAGLYSYVMLPWCRGRHENPFVSKPIFFFDSCDVAGPAVDA